MMNEGREGIKINQEPVTSITSEIANIVSDKFAGNNSKVDASAMGWRHDGVTLSRQN